MTRRFSLVQIDPNLPKDEYYQVTTFAGGLDLRDAPEDMPQGSSPDMLDVEVSSDDRLIRAPGVTQDEDLGHTPTQIILHPGPHFESDLLMFAGGYLGIKNRGATSWYNLSLRGQHWSTTDFAGVLLLTDGDVGLYYREAGQNTITLIPDSNVGQAITVFAGRVLLGGTIMDGGQLDLMGVAWSAASSDFKDWTGEGAEREVLIGSMKRADRIQGFGSLGFNQLAIVCRRSLWIGTPTGDVFRPINFEPRLEDTGCTHRDTIVTTEFGVLFLSEDGLRLFDGTQAIVVSEQINAELLPINEAGAYSATLDPTRKRYYLFTPTATYIFDILRKRWYKWSAVFTGATFFPVQAPLGPTWGAAVGTWGAQVLAWWQLLPQESGGNMMFVKAQKLGHEDATATGVFGVATTPYWFDRRQVGQNQESLITHLATYLTYKLAAASNVEIWLPKTGSGEYEAVGTAALTVGGAVTSKTMLPHIHTGRGIGFGLKILSGFPRIRKASVRYQVITTEIFEGNFGSSYPDPPQRKGTLLEINFDGALVVAGVTGDKTYAATLIGGGGGGAFNGGGGGGVRTIIFPAVNGPVAVHIGAGGLPGLAGGDTVIGVQSASGGSGDTGSFGGQSGAPTNHLGGEAHGVGSGGDTASAGGGGGGADPTNGTGINSFTGPGVSATAGKGGNGLSTMHGIFGGGGGGGATTIGIGSGTAGGPGLGGGGAGAVNDVGFNGADGTGGGGGGGSSGGRGGKGKVIIEYDAGEMVLSFEV